jgi:GNAT superfamily N-acetyltransferase
MPVNRDVKIFDKAYHRQDFDCDHEVLNRYLKYQLSQDVKRKLAVAYVILEGDRVIGFYTLSASAVYIGDLTANMAKKLPKYPLVPVTLLGRLAVDKAFQGQGLGNLLLMDALYCCKFSAESVASLAVVVDAIDANAVAFYQAYDFEFLLNQQLFLPMQKIDELFNI